MIKSFIKNLWILQGPYPLYSHVFCMWLETGFFGCEFNPSTLFVLLIHLMYRIAYNLTLFMKSFLCLLSCSAYPLDLTIYPNGSISRVTLLLFTRFLTLSAPPGGNSSDVLLLRSTSLVGHDSGIRPCTDHTRVTSFLRLPPTLSHWSILSPSSTPVLFFSELGHLGWPGNSPDTKMVLPSPLGDVLRLVSSLF